MKKLFVSIFLLSIAMIAPQDAAAQIGKDIKKNLGIKGKKNKEDPKLYTPEADLITVGGPFADKGMTNATHSKYVGQIVFSNSKISMDNPDESSFKNSFGISENLYGRLYMPKSVENYPIYSTSYLKIGDTSAPSHNQYGKFFYNIYIDGEIYEWWNIETVVLSKKNNQSTTTYQVWINPKPEDMAVNDAWKDIIKKLTDGEHTIRVDAVPGSPSSYVSPTPVASGEFKLTKGSGESFVGDYGKTFDEVEAKMTNTALETEMLTAARDHAKVNSWKEDFKAVKIANRDWTTIYHELTGAVVRRIIDVHCYAVWPDGHCTTQKFVFGQEYNGKEYSKTIRLHNVTYGSYAVNLNCK